MLSRIGMFYIDHIGLIASTGAIIGGCSLTAYDINEYKREAMDYAIRHKHPYKYNSGLAIRKGCVAFAAGGCMGIIATFTLPITVPTLAYVHTNI